MDKGQIFLMALTAFCWLLLWYLIARPVEWSRLVDKENDFWVNRGIVSASFSDRFRRFEKGIGLKVLVGIGAILGTVGFLVIRFLIWKHSHKS